MRYRFYYSRIYRLRSAFVAAACLVVNLASQGAQTTRDERAVIVPTEVISLFDGRSLANFYTWQEKGVGREDPDRVFSVVDAIDGAPAIRISGQRWGGLVSRQRFANYRLVVEFRWGTVTWGKRAEKARDSGILLHSQGEDGNRDIGFDGPWMRSVECQIIEGGTGDILLVRGYDRGADKPFAPRLTATVTPGTKVWNPEGSPMEFSIGRIDWQYRDPAWKDVVGFRGRQDVERPWGEWNRLEVICREGDVKILLNGTKVNEGKNGSATEGKLLFQSEGAEIFFRKIELHPLQ